MNHLSLRNFSNPQLQQYSSRMDSVKGSHRAFIALGSNMGDRVDMIEKACLEMDRANIKVKRTSSLFETAPMYVLDQDPFMNGVCEVGQCRSIQEIRKHRLTITRWKRPWNPSNY